MRMKNSVDVLVIGAGHNGLVAALLLARKGLNVLVVEEKNYVGGRVAQKSRFEQRLISGFQRVHT